MHRGRGRRRGFIRSRRIRTEGRDYRDSDVRAVSGVRRGVVPAAGECLDRRFRALCPGQPGSMTAGDTKIEQSPANHGRSAARDIQTVIKLNLGNSRWSARVWLAMDEAEVSIRRSDKTGYGARCTGLDGASRALDAMIRSKLVSGMCGCLVQLQALLTLCNVHAEGRERDSDAHCPLPSCPQCPVLASQRVEARQGPHGAGVAHGIS
jgi:hypothetical protein